MVKQKIIDGYNGKYLIFSDGRVFTKYHKNGYERFLKPIKTKDGYLSVNLYMGGKTHLKRIHRLVAEAFIPNLGEKPYVNHIDGNKVNNDIKNLEWCTQKENVQHAIHILNKWSNSEKQKKTASDTGKKNRKLDINTASEIRKEYSTTKTSSIKLSKKYGLSKPCILRILNNKSYVEVKIC